MVNDSRATTAFFEAASVLETDSRSRQATSAKVVVIFCRIEFQSLTAGEADVSTNLSFRLQYASRPCGYSLLLFAV